MTPAVSIDDCRRLADDYVEACRDEAAAYVWMLRDPHDHRTGRAYRRATGLKIARDAALCRACLRATDMGMADVGVPLYTEAMRRAAAAAQAARVEASDSAPPPAAEVAR